ncbi:MAG: TaqI-like C-terminal specificity domain-containing protein, partial [Candidatus Heimdallarchaeaceae archaeon]
LGFVLPKSIFRVRSFESLRKFLIENTKLMHIYDIDHYFKDVRGDQVLLIFQKKNLTSAEMKIHQVKIYIHKNGLSFDNPYTYKISQSKFLDYEYFPIFYHQDVARFEQKFRRIEENFETISEGNIFRGLDISMNSGLVLKEQKKRRLTIYRGDSISRFGIKYPLYIEQDSLKQTSKSRIDRISNNKIILQNITSKEGGIYATTSTKDELTLDTVTNILVDESLLKYCVGVLNSIVANFYVIFIVFLNSNFTMHTDRTYIGKIPLVIPEPEKRKEVEKIADSLMQIEDKFSQEFFDVYNKLNKKLLDIYSFTISEQKRMRELIKEVMSRKHNGRPNE